MRTEKRWNPQVALRVARLAMIDPEDSAVII
jgi:hypothetical protein